MINGPGLSTWLPYRMLRLSLMAFYFSICIFCLLMFTYVLWFKLVLLWFITRTQRWDQYNVSRLIWNLILWVAFFWRLSSIPVKVCAEQALERQHSVPVKGFVTRQGCLHSCSHFINSLVCKWQCPNLIDDLLQRGSISVWGTEHTIFWIIGLCITDSYDKVFSSSVALFNFKKEELVRDLYILGTLLWRR